MRQEIIQKLKKGQKVEDLLGTLRALRVGSKALVVDFDYRCRPYLDHAVVGWTDGPPSSNVVAVLSGADTDGAHWRRFTITRTGAGKYEIDVFPTPFNNPESPLSPGIPPGASKRFS